MTYFKHCPIPVSGGGDCWEQPHPASQYGLCAKHWRKIVSGWHESEPSVELNCCRCSWPVSLDPVDIAFARCPKCHELIHDAEVIRDLVDKEDAERDERLALRGAMGVVYYMRFGNRVKIGFTSDIRTRVLAVPNDEVLAAEPGSYETERERHQQFSGSKIAAFKEWFGLTPDLIAHISEIRDRHGDPFALSDAQNERRQSGGAD